MTSLKTRVHALLQIDAVVPSVVGTNPLDTDDAIARRLRADSREVNSVLWSLQKAGMVSFSESHTARGSVISRIRLTDSGMRANLAKDVLDEFTEPTPPSVAVVPLLMPKAKEVTVPASLPAPTSNKGRLLAFMMERATPGSRNSTHPTHLGRTTQRRGWVGMDVRGLSRATGISEHDVVHSLHDMREQGLVDFDTRTANRKGNGGDVPVRLRVTPTAFSLISTAMDDMAPSDWTEPATPAPEPVAEATEPEVDVDSAPEPVAAPEPPQPVVEVASVLPDLPVRALPDLAAYPLLADLLSREGRRSKVAAAAELLVSAGFDEMAFEALDKVPTDSPSEREMVSLLRSLGY